jgi:signal transduction histidine kinase
MFTHSMRLRLTMLFLLIFGAAQGLLWFIADRVRTDQVFREVDRQLLMRAQDMVEAVRQRDRADPNGGIEEIVESAMEPFEAAGFHFELRHADGTIIHRSRNLTGYELPFADVRRQSPQQYAAPDLRTIESTWIDPLFGHGGKLRVATLSHLDGEEVRFHLQVAMTLEPTLRAIGESRRLLVVSGVVSLVLAALTAWFVSGRSLAPLQALVRTVRDVSAAKLERRSDVQHGKDEVGTAIDAVNDMLDRLERDFHALERFVSDIAHELKTPVAVLLGEAREARRSAAAVTAASNLPETVETECRKMLRTIEAFLILARAKSQVRLPPTTPVSLEEVVLTSVQACHEAAREKRIRIVPQFDAADAVIEPHVAGDADLLRSMIDNLLSNAIRYAPSGSTIDVRVACSARDARMSVRDRGPGISEAQMDQVFDRFRQFGVEKKRAGSAGLGLAIVQSVAKLHGGAVSVQNVDPGCEFTVELPLASVSW